MTRRHFQRSEESAQERRASLRYPLSLELAYRVSGGEEGCDAGRGITLDISSTGLRFRTDTPLAVGVPLELTIAWPSALDDGVKLALWVYGRILRYSDGHAAVRIERYAYRTRANPAWKSAECVTRR